MFSSSGMDLPKPAGAVRQKVSALLHQICMELQCSNVQAHMEDGGKISRKRNMDLSYTPRCKENIISFASKNRDGMCMGTPCSEGSALPCRYTGTL
jgi:hypothetical protein